MTPLATTRLINIYLTLLLLVPLTSTWSLSSPRKISNNIPQKPTNFLLSRSAFNKSVVSCGFPPPPSDVYKHFCCSTKNFTKSEQVMFLAQLIHESAGFRHREEFGYRNKQNHGAYKDSVGLPGRDYHGRGFIQLTWAANYEAASRELFKDDRLLRNPRLVAESSGTAMLVSVWYWKARVRPALRGRENSFGVTTKAINPNECEGSDEYRARKRFHYYLKVADAVGLEKKAKEDGCYS